MKEKGANNKNNPKNPLGLKVGFEIHQQLDAGKLFCKCPSDLRDDKPDTIIRRNLYAVAGESGKVDVAAAYENSKKRTYIYEGYKDTTCEVEFDDSPPREINEEALKVALHVCILLNAKPVSVAQVMRKTVVDGSNTSGFQRTMLLAKNGFVEVGNKRIRIDAIALEEDAGRRVAETKDSVTFRLDRLGIPLIEIATAPDVDSADDAKAVVLKIGEILRACRVKRGIGTIRQDVNVSIAGGDRTELKGVQEPALIEKAINWEIARQQELIAKGEKVERTVRNALPDASNKFLRPIPGAARMYPETDLPFVKITDKILDEARRTLPKLRSEMRVDLAKKGLSEEYSKILVDEGLVDDFEELFDAKADANIDANLIAKLLVLYPKDIANRQGISIGNVKNILNMKILREISELLSSKKLQESSLKELMFEVVKGKKVSEALKGFKPVDASDVKKEIEKIIKDKPGLTLGGYMGLVRQKLPNAPGKDVMEILKKLLGQ